MPEKGIISNLHRILRTIPNHMACNYHDDGQAPEGFN